MIKRYSELIKIPTFKERYEYLRIGDRIGDFTFGGHRSLNQVLYRLPEWKRIRHKVILRDEGCDLAHKEFPIDGKIYVHHIVPITIDDILERNPLVFELENLVSTTLYTHNAIHFGNYENSIPFSELLVRKKNDTCPWK